MSPPVVCRISKDILDPSFAIRQRLNLLMRHTCRAGIFATRNDGAEHMKRSVDQTLMRAKSHANKGEIDKAQDLYRSLLTEFPKNKRAQLALAKLKNPNLSDIKKSGDPSPENLRTIATLLTRGSVKQAVQSAKALTHKYPQSSALWDMIGGAHKAAGELEEAETALRKAAEISPKSAQIQNNLGVILKAAEKNEEAITAYQKAADLKPDYAEAYFNLGNVFYDTEAFKKAAQAYQKAVDAKPDHLQAYVGLGNAQKECGEQSNAIASYEKAIEIDPDHVEAYYGMADALRDDGKLDASISTYQKALELRPNFANAYFNMASAFKEKGEIEEAVASYQKALSLRPNFPACYAEATSLKGFPVDEELEQKLIKIAQSENLTVPEQRHSKYALYNVCNRLKKHEAAFKWLVAAAEVRRKELEYSIREDHELFKKIYALAPEYLRNYEFTYEAKKTPIFIVGMPRSGTTLTEQIVSSHSDVHGAGELSAFAKIMKPLIHEETFSPKHVLRLRVKYLEYIEGIGGDEPFVTDKMPHNFRFLPMMCAALPEAKIVHIYRDPRATCWSNFSSNFKSAQLGYSFNLDTVVEYYKIYCMLVQEWARVLGDKVYHLSYEALVNDQESETRQLIDYLGIGWEDSVLSPHENAKSVRTASAEQVRQPVYKNSSEKWMLYEPYLSTAFKTMEGFKKPT
jgi:tetratricopeptide (TPR) repeat protein